MIILDLETKGFTPEKSEIIEFGAVLVDEEYTIIGQYSTLIQPREMPSEFIQDLTGITEYMLVSAPPLEEVKEFISQYLLGHALVGHNIKVFDLKFLQHYGIITSEPEIIDTLELAKQRLTTPKYSLEFLVEHLHLSEKSAHRALEDSMATLELLKYLYGTR